MVCSVLNIEAYHNSPTCSHPLPCTSVSRSSIKIAPRSRIIAHLQPLLILCNENAPTSSPPGRNSTIDPCRKVHGGRSNPIVICYFILAVLPLYWWEVPPARPAADPGFELRICRPKFFIYNSVKLFLNSVIIIKLNVIWYTHTKLHDKYETERHKL